MTGLAIFAAIVGICFVAAALWLTALFLRAPSGFQNGGGFGIDRRRRFDPNASAADRRMAAGGDAGRVRARDRSPRDRRATQRQDR